MQSWMHSEAGDIRKLTARDFMMVIGSNPPELLDRPSFVEAIKSDFSCIGFRLGESVVRRHGRAAWFTSGAELELKVGSREWSGRFLITGLWRKHRIGGWKLVERTLCSLDADDRLAASIRRMQMWQG